MKPYYEDGAVTLYHGDALEVMCDLPAEAVEVVVTSPKYNMGLTPGGNGRGMYGHTTQKASRFTTEGYDGESDAMDPDDYQSWLNDAVTLMARVASHAVFLNHRPRVIHGDFTPPLPTDARLYPWLDEATEGRFRMRKLIVWDRGTGIDVNLTNFCTRQEWIYVYAWDRLRLVDHSASGMGDVWRLGMERNSGHPAPFPMSLPLRCIQATGATSVLDPFAGSGTTLRAAKDLGVRAIGVELSERYCEMTANRLSQEVLDLGGAS